MPQISRACAFALLIEAMSPMKFSASLSIKRSMHMHMGFIRVFGLKYLPEDQKQNNLRRIASIRPFRSFVLPAGDLRLSSDRHSSITSEKTIKSSPYDGSLRFTSIETPTLEDIAIFNQLPAEVFSFAPLMKHTHRHWRYFFRLLTRKSWVYTEMTSADQVVTRDAAYISQVMSFSPEEHPIALQLGGADPATLAVAARIAVRDFGYDAINLNCGCPSSAVAGLHSSGAALMLDPTHAARCCAAIVAAVPGTPVTVKCRTGVAFSSDGGIGGGGGVDPREIGTYEGLRAFVQRVAEDGGVRRFAVHARAALLDAGTIDNRLVPPLNRPAVIRLAADFPALSFILNGAIADPAEAAALLADGAGSGRGEMSGRGGVQGVMVGRAIVNHPWAWATLDTLVHHLPSPPPTAATRGAALAAYADYAAAQTAARTASGGGCGGDVDFHRDLAAPVFNLLAGEPCAAAWRRSLSRMVARGAPADRAIRAAAAAVPREVLDAPAGAALAELPRYGRAPPSVGQLRPTIT
jgi:tRNA-dihydrouridine synthase A